MPVVYTFTASIIMPTSATWPCMDVTTGAMPNLLLFPEVTPTRGAPWIAGELPSKDLVLYSDDGILTQIKVSLPIGQRFTLQVGFKTTSAPHDLRDLNASRIFIGAYDSADNGGGILISKLGIAIVGEIGSSALVLPGSFGIIEEGETYYTLRIVVDGVENTMNIYITKSDELGVTGHVLRYTTSAPTTPSGTLDEVRIDVLGTGKKSEIKLDTIKLNCLEALIPNKRPIADPGADQSANIGSAVTHDGTNSYDPEGLSLTHEWVLKDAPDGSRFKISGGGGSTVPDAGAEGFTTLFTTTDLSFNVTNAPLLQPGDHLFIEGVYYQVSPGSTAVPATEWVSDPETGRYQRGSGFTGRKLTVTTDTIPDNLSSVDWVVYHTSTYFSDVAHPYPVGIPDTIGVYIAGLTVNDGELDSLESEGLLNVNSTSVPLGCIPDVSWIWDHLSDFWELVEDRDKIETAWSGFAQAAAAQLLTAWQIDYGKSLLDIQRVFQRRWLYYEPLLVLEPDDATVRIVRGPIFSTDLAIDPNIGGETLQLVLDNGSVQTITFAGGGTQTAQQIVDKINVDMGFGGAVKLATLVSAVGGERYLRLDYPYLLRIRPNGTANVLLGFSTTAYMQNDLSGSAGAAVSASVLDTFEASTPVKSTGLDFDNEGIIADDFLVAQGAGYKIKKTAYETFAAPIERKSGLTLRSALPDNSSYAWLVTSFITVTGMDFDTAMVTVGDLLRFELKSPEGTISEVFCEVTASSGIIIGFDPLPLLQAYDGQASEFTTKVTGIKRLTYIPVDDLVLEVPRLQEVIKDPPSVFDQNVDYTIENVTGIQVVKFRDGVFAPLDPPPDIFWAEVTYLDNSPTIEENFGRLVNFKVEDLETRTENLDYLSAVRGLWWAYFGGPSLYKVRVGTQILLGLPFAEAEGIITEIGPHFSAVEGRILIEDVADNTISRTYFFPLSAGLAVNEITGEQIAEGDTVEQFAPLSGGVEVVDYIKDPNWLNTYISLGAFHELEKYFRFLVRGDVDTFNLVNLLFAIDFVKKIRPHYAYPLFTLLKNIGPDEVNVSDQLTIDAYMYLYDSSCPTQFGAYRWDDVDGAGAARHSYDDVPAFLADKQRLCPSMVIWGALSYDHPGGAGWPYDTLWAFDDGDIDGDSISDDYLPLSGPDSSPPAPYGPLVGVLSFDSVVPAGTYWRSRPL